MKPVLLGTGLSGLIGSRVAELLKDRFEIINLDLSNLSSPVDILEPDSLRRAVSVYQAVGLLHAAAFTDVTAAWQQSNDKSAAAYQVNVVGTQNVVEAVKGAGLYLVHLSTAYVFDGQKKQSYLETDTPNPIEWYGKTKLEAEQIVLANLPQALILRIDQPFRSTSHKKPDVLRRIAQHLIAGDLLPQFSDHFVGPTYVDDLARVIDWALQTQPAGIWHATQGESWSDYAFAQQIAELLQLDPKLVRAGSLQQYLKQQTRPYQANTALNTDKLVAALPFKLKSVKTALTEAVATL